MSTFSLTNIILGKNLGATIIRAVLGSAGLRIASMLLSFLVGVILARNLGASGYGVYALVMSITALLTVPTEFGLPSLVVREVASANSQQDWGRMHGILRWSTAVVVVLGGGLLGLMMVWLLIGNSDDEIFLKTLFFGVLLIPIVALSNLRGATLRGLEQIIRGQLPELILRPGLFLIILLSVIWFTDLSLDASNVMGLHVIATAIAFIVGVILLLKALPPKCKEAEPVIESKKWMTSAFPMALTEGMRFLQGHLATLLLGWFAIQADIGVFRVAMQVGLLVAIPITLLNVVVGSYISRFYAENEIIKLKKIVRYSALGMFFGVLILSTFFIVFGQYFLEVFFGAEFKEAYYALIIICIGQLVTAIFGPGVVLLNMVNQEHAVTRGFIISLVISASIGLVLVPFYGIIGAAIASVSGLIVWSILLWSYARRTLDINTSIISI